MRPDQSPATQSAQVNVSPKTEQFKVLLRTSATTIATCAVLKIALPPVRLCSARVLDFSQLPLVWSTKPDANRALTHRL